MWTSLVKLFLLLHELPKVGLLYEVYKLCPNILTTEDLPKVELCMYSKNLVKIFLLL